MVISGHQWPSATHRVIELERSLVALKLAQIDDYAAAASGDDHLLVMCKRTFHCLEGACPVDAHGADRMLHEEERSNVIKGHQWSSVVISGAA